MDHTEDHPNEENQEPNSERESTRSESREAFDHLGDAVRNAWKAGTSDARKAAREAVPKAKQEFERGFHDLAWGAAYVFGFGAALARELSPDCVNEGWDQGAEAGRDAAEKMTEKCRRAASDGSAGPPEDGSSAPDSPPGLSLA